MKQSTTIKTNYTKNNFMLKELYHSTIRQWENKVFNNILARQSGIDHIPVICFETSFVNMDEAKPLIKSNQLENPIPSNKIGSSAASFST